MGVLNVEIVGGLCIIYLMTRLDNVYSFSHQLLKGIQFFLPPSDEDIARLQPIVHKRAKKAPRQKSLLEKIELLNLQAIPIRAGLLLKQPLWDVYDFMVFSVIVAILNHLWSEAYTCVSSNLTGHEWPFWVTLFTLILCINAAVYSTMIVGFQLSEGRYAAGCGIASYMAATLVLYRHLDGFKLFAQQLLAFTQHFIPHQMAYEQVIVAASIAVTSLMIAALVGGMYVPAYRFSRLHLELLGTKDTTSARFRLLVDMVLPLLAACAWVFGAYLPAAPVVVQGIQLALTLLFVCSRISLFRDHLQHFLLGVRAVLVPELAKEPVDGDEIQERVLLRFKYIAIASSEYMSFPLAVVCLLLILHLKGTLNFGLCAWSQSMMGMSAMRADEGLVEPTPPQTLMDILQAHQDMPTTVAALKSFFKAVNQLSIIPPQLLGHVVSITLGMTLTCWFAIYTSCLLYWKFGGRVLSNVLNLVTGDNQIKRD